MPLMTSSLAKICGQVREHVHTLGQDPSPTDWDVDVTIGAPGVNQAKIADSNTLNLFFYRFEPAGFQADAQPGDVQWMRMFCVITAFGVDEDIDLDGEVDFSSGFNELRMLSQVMRLFQEQPVVLMEGESPTEIWHTQFIPRPLEDEQINQIWSAQGDTVYRPSLVYEIALAPIEPLSPASQAARVGLMGTYVHSDMDDRHVAWPSGREALPPLVPNMHVDSTNPQWAPAILLLSGTGDARQASLSLNLEVPVLGGGTADFSAFPQVDIWIAGDTGKTGDLTLVGQLLQNPDADQSSGNWVEIDPVTALDADSTRLDTASLPTGTAFTLVQSHWTDIANNNNSWQLQLFVERHIAFQPDTGLWADLAHTAEDGIRIRSNPLLISLTREAP
jgi:hypothetical protein